MQIFEKKVWLPNSQLADIVESWSQPMLQLTSSTNHKQSNSPSQLQSMLQLVTRPNNEAMQRTEQFFYKSRPYLLLKNC
jgi:hypothetical protein